MRTLLVAIAALVLTGCPDPDTPPYVYLGGITTVPPGSTASIVNNLDKDIHSVALSVGVAIATRCSDYCPKLRENCASMHITSDDPAVLDVRSVYRGGKQPTEAILVAKQVGTTVLVVSTACATEEYEVNVLPRGP